jgi:MoaA/NifB/PqqE/SkfB family radical SAM enzyme
MKQPDERFSEIRIESTNHCEYRCFICPREQMTRPQGFLALDDLAIVLDRVGDFRGRVDLHGFGEPLLDDGLVEKIRLVSKRWPAAVVRIFSTLGVDRPPNLFEDLPAAGLDHIEVSLYGADPIGYRRIHGVDRFHLAVRNLENLCRAKRDIGADTVIVVREFPSHASIGLGKDELIQRRALTDRFLSWGVDMIRHRDLHNYGNGRRFVVPQQDRICSVVAGYRSRILKISWELDVISCPFDFDGSVVFGNLRDQELNEILGGDAYRQFIQDHINGTVDRYPACRSCERCFQP